MAITPTRLVEVEFDAGVWTNIADDVVAVTTNRGRNKESGAFETGTMVFVVRNDDRTYDPDYAAGPYYGKLRPNRRVRLRATYDGVTYDVFTGYIDRIAQVYGGPNDATAEFQVSDRFKLLNRIELPSSVYAATVAESGPFAWWPLGDPDAATYALDAIGGKRLSPIGAPSFGEGSLPVRDPDGAVSMPSADDGLQGLFPPGTFPITSAGSIEFWYRKDEVSNDPLVSMYVYADPIPFGVDSTIDSGGDMDIVINDSAGNSRFVGTSGAVLNDMQPHHIVITWSTGSDIAIYIDGVNLATGISITFIGDMTNTDAPWVVAINAVDLPGVYGVGFGSIATYDELAIYDRALSSSEVAAHNAAGRTPWNDQQPRERLEEVFALAGLTAADQDYNDTGAVWLQATDLGGSALSYAQAVEETERGWLFVARDGKVRWIGWEGGNTGDYLVSQATFVDDDSGAGIPYRYTSADVDESRIITRATVSREGSVAVTVENAAAIAEYQIVDETHEGLLHADDEYSRAYAEWLVNAYSSPSTRVGTLTLELSHSPDTMYPAVLGLEIADRVTYRRRPQNIGDPIDIPMRVEGIAHETGGHYWRTHLQLSPFNLTGDDTPVFIWGTTEWDEHVWGLSGAL